jgi:hypothetical protein
MGMSWSWLSPWRRSAIPLNHLRLILYTRRGCQLCEDAWIGLHDAQKRFGFALESVDVDSDADLVARFGDWVPVVTVNGKLRFKGGVNPVLLTRLLRAEARRERPKA